MGFLQRFRKAEHTPTEPEHAAPARADRPEAAVSAPAAPAAADPVLPPADPLTHAAELEAAGRFEEAIAVLSAADAEHPDPALEIALIDLRARAAAALEPEAGREPWPPVYEDPFPDVRGAIPEIAATELTTEILGGAVSHHGALLVRGVFSPEQIQHSLMAIERTHAQRVATGAIVPEGDDEATPAVEVDLADDEDGSAWFRPFPVDAHNGMLRNMVARQGGTWLADSPASTARILAELEASGVTGAISGHLGERPFFSLQKSTLRRSLPRFNLVAWHQDGSFLDSDVRTMNVWVALSPCGGDRPSPGLEIYPERLPEILPVDGIMSPHSVSYDLVAELAATTPTVIPEFGPGDALLFDERLLHRTHLTTEMSEIRYALECWFFAPSHQVTSYTPLLV